MNQDRYASVDDRAFTIARTYGYQPDMTVELAARIVETADRLGANPFDLANLIHAESGFRPRAIAPKGADPTSPGFRGAVGLIGFLPKTAESLGTTSAAITDMSAVQQMNLVERYLLQYQPINSKQRLFMAVFYPRAQNWPSDRPFNTDPPIGPLVAAGNRGIATPQQYLDFVGSKAKLQGRPEASERVGALESSFVDRIPARWFSAGGKKWWLSNAARIEANRIRNAFIAKGYDDRMAMAAIANALAESDLNPDAIAHEPDGTTSAGLFMLNDGPRSAGAGMTISERQHPDLNIARILQVIARSPEMHQAWWNDNVNAVALTGMFTEYIERPSQPADRAHERMCLAEVMFARDLPPIEDPICEPTPEAPPPNQGRTHGRTASSGGGGEIAIASLLAALGLLGLLLR